MRDPSHSRVETLVLGRSLEKERDEMLSDIPEWYDDAAQRERMRKIVGAAFDCGVVAAMKAMQEREG